MKRLVFVLALFGMSCQTRSTPPKQVLRVNLESEPGTFDPRRARTTPEVSICRMLFEGLTRISKKGEVELALAEAVEVSDDGLEYVFHLRKTVWSNGDPVLSTDFANSWRAILDPSFPSDIAYQLYLIQNGQKVKAGELGLEQLGIWTPDAETLVVKLEQPIPYFLDVCAMSYYFPVPSFALENNNWASDPLTFVGNGPFRLHSWDRGYRAMVTKNLNYWESDDVHLQEIDLMLMSNDTELRMFEKQKLDWAGSPLSTIPADAIKSLKETHQLKASPLSGTCFLRVNTIDQIGDKPNPLSHRVCRRALAMAVDRQGIAEHILQGGHSPAFRLVPREMGLFVEDVASTPQEPRELLTQALHEMGRTQESMDHIVLNFVICDRNMAIAQALQHHWEATLGIPIRLEALESKVFFQKLRQRDYQLALSSWIADFNDPVNFLELFKFRSGSTNNTHWENEDYIQCLNRSQICKSPEERKRLLREAEEILMAEMPMIPLFHYVLNYLERDGVEGIALSPIGGIDFRWAHIR